MLFSAESPSVLSSLTHPKPQSKPYVLLVAAPWFSHVNNLRIIALDLVRRGHEVIFMTGSVFKDTVEKTGATFVALSGNADFDGSKVMEFLPEWGTKGGTVEQIQRDFGDIFNTRIAAQHASIQAVLRDLSRRGKGPVVLLHDNLVLGALPIIFGAPGIRPPIISIGITPLMNCSIDTAPFGTGLPPDNTEEGRVRNAVMTAGAIQALAPLTAAYRQVMESLGVTKPTGHVFDDMVLSPDKYLQLSIPSLEPPRSDLRPGLSFIGTVPTNQLEDPHLPPWWPLILANTKPLIVITQGTLSNAPEDLTIPALEALRALPDLLVIATLVRTPDIANYTPPANARLAQWLPFSQLFPLAAVVVNNGGYGTINLAFSLGVPMVLAGLSEDKKETCARAAWTGAAVDLKCERPTVEALKEAVGRVLRDPRFKRRAMELREEYARCDGLRDIAAAVEELGSVGAEEEVGGR